MIIGNVIQTGKTQIIGAHADILVTGSVIQTDTVTATNNGTVINGKWNGSSFIISPITFFGTWTVSVTGSVSKTYTVDVDTATIYTITVTTTQVLTFADFSDYLNLNATYSQSTYAPIADFYTCGAYSLCQKYVWMRTTLPINISGFSNLRVAGSLTKDSGDSSGVITGYASMNSSGSEGSISTIVPNATTLDNITGSGVSYKEYDTNIDLSNYKALYGSSVYIYLGIYCKSSWWGYGYYNTAVELS